MVERKEIGARGEAIAAKFLERLGYRIRERNYRCPLGELDLVALDGEYLVFVEVKTRSPGAPLSPSLSVTARKKAKVRQLGEYYCSQHPELPLQPRFDVVAVVTGTRRQVGNGIMQADSDRGAESPEMMESVEHIINAF